MGIARVLLPLRRLGRELGAQCVSRRRTLRTSLQQLASVGMLLAAGCGGPASAPTGAGATAGGPPPAKRPHLMLILPTTDGDDVSILREVLQDPENGAGRDYIYREGIVRSGMPPAQQAEVIEESLKKGASALLVVAADPKAVAPALEEARDRKIPVVVIGREIPVEGKPLPLVTFAPAEEPASRILAQLGSRDGEPSGSDAPAVVLTDSAGGWRMQDLVGALKRAAEAASRPAPRVVRFEKRVAVASDALATTLEADPAIHLVLFEDRLGAEAAAQVADLPAIGRGRDLRLGGFVADRDPRIHDALAKGAVVMNRKVDEAARQAARMALKMLKEEPVPDRVAIEPELLSPSIPVEGSPTR